MAFDRYEVLTRHYLAEIRRWDWQGIVKDAQVNGGYEFLGTVFGLAPSGKFYMPWTTNQTRKDEIKDECFYGALDTVAEENGGWIESGEGDACDLFFRMDVETEDDETEEN